MSLDVTIIYKKPKMVKYNDIINMIRPSAVVLLKLARLQRHAL